MVVPDKKSRVKAAKRPKTRRSSQRWGEDSMEVKIKKEEVTSPLVSPSPWSGGLVGAPWWKRVDIDSFSLLRRLKTCPMFRPES